MGAASRAFFEVTPLERNTRSESVELLLRNGLDLYGQGHVEQAIARWNEVLRIQPGEPRAIDYLRSVTETEPEPEPEPERSAGDSDSPITRPGSSMRVELERLLQQRRYEEALDLLHQARWQTPNAAEISRGIQLVKQKLIKKYLHAIGSLDRVPRRRGTDRDIAELGLGDEERGLLRLVDGISSFGDIAHESRFGLFETYRMLARFLDMGLIEADHDAIMHGAITTTGHTGPQIVTISPQLARGTVRHATPTPVV